MDFKLAFIGIGAARCGTSWIASTLGQHPEIFIPKRKELHYFSKDSLYDENLTKIKEYFKPANAGQILGEYTPRYAISPKALERIAKHFPEVKLIYSIREPLARAYSQYHYFRSNKGKEKITDFVSALEGPFYEDYIKKSLYSEQLDLIYKLFDKKNVKVIVFEEMLKNQEENFRDLFRFLAVDEDFAPDLSGSRRNNSSNINSSIISKLRRLAFRVGGGNPKRKYLVHSINKMTDRLALFATAVTPIQPQLRQELINKYFYEDMQRLKEIHKLDLSSWSVKSND